MHMIAELAPAEWLDETEKKIARAQTQTQTQLIDRPTPGQPDPATDPRSWIRTDFHTFRMGMQDNDPSVPRLARIKRDFVATIGALNFGAQCPWLSYRKQRSCRSASPLRFA